MVSHREVDQEWNISFASTQRRRHLSPGEDGSNTCELKMTGRPGNVRIASRIGTWKLSDLDIDQDASRTANLEDLDALKGAVLLAP